MRRGGSKTIVVLKVSHVGILFSVASVYLFLGASLRFREGLLNAYADVHIFLVESSGEGIGSGQAGNVNVGLIHDELVLVVQENWK